MSYCRFSTECFRSDVYVWADVEGHWAIAVAGNRYISPEDRPVTEIDPNNVYGSFILQHRLESEWVSRALIQKIGLPHDGALFECATPKDCVEKLMELRAMGYYVPQSAVDSLLEEEEEG